MKRNLLVLAVLTLFTLCVAHELVYDESGSPVFAGNYFFAREYSTDSSKSGFTFEPYNRYDWLLLTNNQSSPGTSIMLWSGDDKSQLKTGTKYYGLMSGSTWRGYNFMDFGLTGIWLNDETDLEMIIYTLHNDEGKVVAYTLGLEGDTVCLGIGSDYQDKRWLMLGDTGRPCGGNATTARGIAFTLTKTTGN